MTTPAPEASVTQPWGVVDALIGFCLGLVGQIVFGAIFGVPTHPTLPQQFVLTIPLWVAFAATPIWATRTRGRGPVADLHLAARPIDLCGLVIGGLVQVVVGWAYLPFVDHDTVERPARELADSAHGAFAKVLLVLMTVVIAPVLEELFYRGFVLGALRRRLPKWAAVAVVAVVFAAMHFEPLQLPGLFVFGFVAGSLFVTTDRLAPSILAHMGFNAVALWQLHVL